MSKLYLLTGSNSNDAVFQLNKAKELLSIQFGEPIAISSLYESEPWGNTQQANFFNQAICFNTNMEALEILNAILNIETKMGRIRLEKWGPRIIDIDILIYDAHIVQLPQLQIPHPHLQDRRFALEPLLEMAPEIRIPGKASGQDLLAHCTDNLKVWKVAN